MKVKCNKCNFIGEETEFRKRRDFFQFSYISGCPECDNSQSAGNASMRMLGEKRPFEYIKEEEA